LLNLNIVKRKESIQMNTGKIFICALFMLGLALALPSGQVVAFEEPPSQGSTILGPELWGVVVYDCTDGIATLRVKSVQDCRVVVDAKTSIIGQGCGSFDQNAALYFTLDGVVFNFEGIPANSVPIITKVKNFETHLDGQGAVSLISFDAQIKFCVGCQ